MNSQSQAMQVLTSTNTVSDHTCSVCHIHKVYGTQKVCSDICRAIYFEARKYTHFWGLITIGTCNECWQWQGAKDKDGYGKCFASRAHRIAYDYSYPHTGIDKLCVCHTCDNPSCCNPTHLWLGTNQENTQDRERKQRTAKGNAKAKKLTSEDVKAIRKLYATGNHTQKWLVNQFCVHQATIREIIQYIIWKEV